MTSSGQYPEPRPWPAHGQDDPRHDQAGPPYGREGSPYGQSDPRYEQGGPLPEPGGGHPYGEEAAGAGRPTDLGADSGGQSGRAQRRDAARAFRPKRTIPALLTALVLAAAAIVTGIAAIAAMARGHSKIAPLTWLGPVGRARWDHPATLAVSAIVCLLGLVLLALALTPGRSRLVALASDDPRTVTGITRTGLRRHLATIASRVDGVSRARVRLHGNRLRVTAKSPLRDTSELPGQVTQAVSTRLAELRPLKPMRVRVAVRRKGMSS